MHSRYLRSRVNKIITTALLSAVGLSACEGGSSRALPEPVTDQTPPEVVRITPEAETTGYEVDFKPTILFSEIMNIDSLGQNSIKIYSGNEDLEDADELIERQLSYSYETVPGDIQVIDEASGSLIETDATKVTISLDAGRLALNTVYTLEVGGEAHDLVEDDIETSEDERNFLSSEGSTFFTTEPGIWHDAETLPLKYLAADGASSIAHGSGAIEPVLKTNLNGDVLLLWKQVVLGQSQLWISQYHVDNGVWGIPGSTVPPKECATNLASTDPLCANSIRLDDGDTTNVFDAGFSLNEEGQVVVSWTQAEAGSADSSVWVNLFDGNSWSGASELLNGVVGVSSTVKRPSVGVTDSGNVVIAWLESVSGIDRVRSTFFSFELGHSGIGFGVPIYLDSHSGALGSARDVAFSLSSQGNGLVAWVQAIDGVEHLRSKALQVAFNGQVTWGATSSVDQVENVQHQVQEPKIALASNGDISLAWKKTNENISVFDLLHARMVAGRWLEAEKLENNDSRSVRDFSLTYTKLNRLFIAWSAATGTNAKLLSVRDFHHEAGWSEPLSLLDAERPIASLKLTFDYEGNGSLVWVQNTDADSRVLSRQYSNISKSWVGEDTLFSDQDGAQNLSLNQQTLFMDGRLLSVWGVSSGADLLLKSSLFKEEIEAIN